MTFGDSLVYSLGAVAIIGFALEILYPSTKTKPECYMVTGYEQNGEVSISGFGRTQSAYWLVPAEGRAFVVCITKEQMAKMAEDDGNSVQLTFKESKK